MHRFVNDERKSSERLVMPHLADALARWLTRNHPDAEDVLQEACLRAFRSIHTCIGHNPRSWVLSVVRNTAYSWLEKNRRGEWNAPAPEAEPVEKANADQLRAAIEAVPVQFRETLVLRDIQGDYREVATIIGAPVGTMMSRLSRARRHLLAAFQKEKARPPALRAEATVAQCERHRRPSRQFASNDLSRT